MIDRNVMVFLRLFNVLGVRVIGVVIFSVVCIFRIDWVSFDRWLCLWVLGSMLI